MRGSQWHLSQNLNNKTVIDTGWVRVENWPWESQRGAAYTHLPCCFSSRILAFLLFSNTQNYGQGVCCDWSLFKKAAAHLRWCFFAKTVSGQNLLFLQKSSIIYRLKTEKLHGSFLRARFKCLNATEPLWESSLRFTTKSPGVPGTHSFDRPRNNERLSPPCSPFYDVNRYIFTQCWTGS